MKTMVNHPRKKMHIHTYKPSLHCQGVQQTSHHPFAKLMLVKNLICTTLQLTKHLHIHYLRGNDSVGKARVDYETHYAGKKKMKPREVESFAQGHRTNEQWSKHVSPGVSDARFQGLCSAPLLFLCHQKCSNQQVYFLAGRQRCCEHWQGECEILDECIKYFTSQKTLYVCLLSQRLQSMEGKGVDSGNRHPALNSTLTTQQMHSLRQVI